MSLSLQCKLELVVGSPASCMDLKLYNVDNEFIQNLDQDDALLGSYPVDDGCRIHVSNCSSFWGFTESFKNTMMIWKMHLLSNYYLFTGNR